MRKKLAAFAATSMLAVGAAAPPALAQQQDGLVNINIENVTILEEVDVAVAANIIAGICVQDVNVLAVDQTGGAVTCTMRGTGRAVAITDNP